MAAEQVVPMDATADISTDAAPQTPTGDDAAGEAGADELDDEIEEMRRKVQEMEDQLAGQRAELASPSKSSISGGGGGDTSSIYVGQVDYSSQPQELHDHFQHCGAVKRVTILCDRYTGHPKGFAYIEFDDDSAVDKAVNLHGSTFKGRELKVLPKRANQPGKGKGKSRKGGKGKGGGGWYSPYGSSWGSPRKGKGKGKGKSGKKSKSRW